MRTLTAYDVLHVNETFYYVCNEFNALAKCENGIDSRLIDAIPDERIFGVSLVSQIMYFKGRMIFIPLNAKKIWIYDIRQEKWKGIEIEDPECKFKFMKGVCYNNKLYLLPSAYKQLVILDLLTDKVSYLDIRKELDGVTDATCFRSDVVVNDKFIYAAYCAGDYVFKFDMNNEKYTWIRLKTRCFGFSGIVWDYGKYWLSPRNDDSKIYYWDGDERCEEYSFENNEGAFSRGINICNEDLYIKEDDKTIVLDRHNPQKIKRITESYIFLDNQDDVIRSLTYGGLYKWKVGGEERSAQLQIDDDVRDAFIEDRITREDIEFLRNSEIFHENKNFGVSDFMKLVLREN